jgi:hypothetical protein
MSGVAVAVACTPYPSVTCTGEAVSAEGARAEIHVATPTTTDWTSVVRVVELPNDVGGSLLCPVSASGENAPSVLEVDEVGLRAADPSAVERPDVGVEGRSLSID